jgi:TetR/AcrR family fatty acid metabolism transcriptional regulator
MILSAAAELFAERGYDCTPIKDIAERARVTPGTIIYHFERKERLLGELALRYLLGLNACCRDRVATCSNAVAGVLVYVSAFHDYLRNHKQESGVYFRNHPMERLKFDKEFGPKIVAEDEILIEILQGLLQVMADGGAISSHLVSSYTRIIQSMLLGGAFMVHFKNKDALVIAGDAVHCVQNLLSDVSPSQR